MLLGLLFEFAVTLSIGTSIRSRLSNRNAKEAAMKQSLFDEIGGMPTFQKVHKIFYDKVYAHEWLGQFYIGHNQEIIEQKQSMFMAVKMGGDVKYTGR